MSIDHTPRRNGPTAALVIGVAIAYANVAIGLVATLNTLPALILLGVIAVATIAVLVRLYRPPAARPAPKPTPDRRPIGRSPVVRELPPGDWPGRPLSSIEGYSEDLELTVWVGLTEDGDRVRERRTTRVTRPLRQRELTLISPYAGMDTGKFSANPRIEVGGGRIEATWLAEDIAGRGTVTFTPAVQTGETLEWTLDYPPAGLWNPLREDDIDVFRYDVRNFPIGKFTVTFRVHKNASAVFVQERNRRGAVSDYSTNGEWVVVWSADSPTPPARFEFDVRVNWGA
ncbi:hypothetical protein DMB66_06865 [Actinoplanes sp. ATCC 53533]|uniref:hypothetical protein n=1 Tax=Actinoplanes sp. ATCC 53533 TaxID=1288362 RepID=UPI000F7A98F0|nr:hypothetical protein [Actinoplanes sp. ATCC 53533]RSM72297.1 hypothetical protein DMB66_06865 [Actinoplanes sp. ATCC 53533]